LGDGQQNTSSYGVTAQAAGGVNAVATPVISEEEDPMEVQFESVEPVETPVVQEVPFGHTFCTESTCFGERSLSRL
jgi:hypothetical protein